MGFIKCITMFLIIACPAAVIAAPPAPTMPAPDNPRALMPAPDNPRGFGQAERTIMIESNSLTSFEMRELEEFIRGRLARDVLSAPLIEKKTLIIKRNNLELFEEQELRNFVFQRFGRDVQFIIKGPTNPFN